jgi:hypothetical protein
MNVLVKRALEIAGGVVIGLVASEVMDKAMEAARKQIANHKAKESN